MDKLSRAIEKMESSLKQQEETQEPRDEVLAYYERYKKLLTDAQNGISLLESNVKAMDKAIKLRKDGYKEILRYTGKSVNRLVLFFRVPEPGIFLIEPEWRKRGRLRLYGNQKK